MKGWGPKFWPAGSAATVGVGGAGQALAMNGGGAGGPGGAGINGRPTGAVDHVPTQRPPDV